MLIYWEKSSYHDQGNHNNSLYSIARQDTELGRVTVFTCKIGSVHSCQGSGWVKVRGKTWRWFESKAETFLHEDKETNWQRTGETCGLYIHTHYHQVKQIRAETDNQGGGWNHSSRDGGGGGGWREGGGGGSGMRGEEKRAKTGNN